MSTALESGSVAATSLRAIPRATGASISLTRTEWCLRIGAAACFIGHGAFGVITREAWVPYFAAVGIGRDLAFALMPIVGAIDISAAILVLLSPRPIVLLYMAVWGMWTALLRPLSGESFFETLERAGNYGVPLALLVLYANARNMRDLIAPISRRETVNSALLGRVLLWSTATLLFAHGALQTIVRKPLFTTLYDAIDVSASVIPVVGAVEMAVALLVLMAPVPALLLGIAAWKIATEALFPIAGAPIWEFVERSGSYAAPIALVLLYGTSSFTRITFHRSSR
jgi:hypothetical protein